VPIAYDIPRIGEKSGTFGQQGPTCWYYAAKMLMKFHEMHKNPKTELQMKPFHELRKILSEMVVHQEREDPRAVQKNLEESLDRLDAKIKKEEANITLLMGKDAEKFKSHIEKLRAEKAANEKRLPNIKRAIETLDKKIQDEMKRAELIRTFVSDANIDFRDLQIDWSQPADIEKQLERWGPFYASGGLSSVQANRTETGTMTKDGGDSVVAVKDITVDSAHAVVVAGIKGGELYYKDPTGSNELRFISLAKFSTGASKAITVNCFYGRETGGCIHQRSRRLW
jgi:hypothetical protein